MSQQVINIGTKTNDNTGDTMRSAMIKVNENFTELYAGGGDGLEYGDRYSTAVLANFTASWPATTFTLIRTTSRRIRHRGNRWL